MKLYDMCSVHMAVLPVQRLPNHVSLMHGALWNVSFVPAVHNPFSAATSFLLSLAQAPHALTAQDMAQNLSWTMAVLRQLALHPPRQGHPPQLGRAGRGPDPGSAAGARLMPLLVLVLLLQTATAQPLPVMPVIVQTQVLAVMQVWLLILWCTFLL